MSEKTLAERAMRRYDQDGFGALVTESVAYGLSRIIPDSLCAVAARDVLTANGLRSRGSLGETMWPLPSDETLARSSMVDELAFCREVLGSDARYEFNDHHDRAEFVHELTAVRLLKPRGLAVTGDGAIVREVNAPSDRRLELQAVRDTVSRYPYVGFTTLFLSHRLAKRSVQRVDIGCSLVGRFSNGYYHWLLEHLPKLRGVEEYAERTGSQPTLIIPEDPAPFVVDSLRLLGYRERDWVEWSAPAVDVDRLVVPSYPRTSHGGLQWLRKRAKESVDQSDTYEDERIYISREGADRRNVANSETLLAELTRLGFEEYRLSELPFSEQIQLFANADIVVSPHGAGLSNILWSDHLAVVEIFNHTVRNHYLHLANVLGHEYLPVQGEGIEGDDINSDIYVDPAKVREAVNQVGRRNRQ